MTDKKPLVFISCGEASETERNLGGEVETLVENLTGARTYRARRRGSLKSRAHEIVQNLNEASAYVIIFPMREECTGLKGQKYRRTSVWIDQELAIAHFCNEYVSPRKVLVFIHDGVRVEGLRNDLKLNETIYTEPQQILDVLKRELPSWLDDVQPASVTQLQLWLDVLVVASGGGKFEEWQVLPRIRNVGKTPIKEWSMELLIPALLPAHSRHHLNIDFVDVDGESYKRITFDHQTLQAKGWGTSQTLLPHSATPFQPPFFDLSVPNPPVPDWQATKHRLVILRARCAPDWDTVHEVRKSLDELNGGKRTDGEPPRRTEIVLQRA